MKYISILLLALLATSCGTYMISTKNSIKIEKVLTITSTGDTLAVPLKQFQKYNYNNVFDNYRFNSFNYGFYNWYSPYNWNFLYSPNSWYYRDWYYKPPIYNNNTSILKERRYYVNPDPVKGRRGSNNFRTNNNNDDKNIRLNPRSIESPEGGNNGWRGRSREDLFTKPVVPGLSNPVQPGQIRRGSRPSVPQQSRGSQSSSGQGRGSSSGPRN